MSKDYSGKLYGSEFHLLRFLGRHRHLLNKRVKSVTGAQSVCWLDYHFNQNKQGKRKDNERKGLDFLPEGRKARETWGDFWPQRGNPNWDAVGHVSINGTWEWLLVEAKAHLGELKQSCGAKEKGGRPKIRAAFEKTKNELGISTNTDWLKRYYQHANRITVLNFMMQHGEPGRMLFIYFCGDSFPNKKIICPENEDGWSEALAKQDEYLGLSNGHARDDRVHKIFVPVTP